MFAASKTSTASSGYLIQRSLRFNSADSSYLNRTPATAGNRRTWTISFWIKKTFNGASYTNIFGAADSASNRTDILWHPSDYLRYYDYPNAYSWFAANSAGGTWNLYRDVAAWYHIVIAVDTTQSINADRVKGYINGSFVANGNTDTYTQNAQTAVNSTISHILGGHAIYGQYMNAYLTEVNFIDGQQLTASSFGETNAQTGVWQPKAYSGSYGTNGFYLNFSDNSNTTAATLGKDYSGNGNNWTPNNFSVTAGAGNDSLVDSPTSYGTDTGVGGTVRGNYSTVNPLDKNSNITLANGNLDVSLGAVSAWYSARSTFGMSSGKWYWEILCNAISGANPRAMLGIMTAQANLNSFVGSDAYGWGYYNSGGSKYTNGADAAYGASYSTNDIIGVAFDADTGSLTFYKNGTSQGVAFSSLAANTYFPAIGLYSETTASVSANFGQRPFAYTAPSGYKALCTQNLPTPTIGATSTTLANSFFTPNLWAGNDGLQTVTNNIDTTNGGGWIWFKGRNLAVSNFLINSNSGYTKYLASNTTAAEDTYDFGFTPSTTGFSFNASSGSVNQSGYTYVAWQWKANGTGVSNTAGSITSTVSANTTSGFSIVTYTGNSTVGATVGHGLGVAPSMMFIKGRTNVDNWHVYSSALGNTGGLFLNLTNAFTVSPYFWNNTSPSSTVFTLSSGSSNNSSGVTYVAYCFSEVAGYSKFGSWTGNGSADGPFVFTGFKPAYILWKRTDSSAGGDWGIVDATRNPSNVVGEYLAADTSGAGATFSMLDMVSNGFKIRWSDTSTNASGATYIYMAFASNPFKYSLAR